MIRRLFFMTSAACLIAIAGCGGRSENPWNTSSDGCRRHDQCGSNQACVFGECVSGRLDEEMSVEDINGALLFANESGFCTWDSDCGPWACNEDMCMSPQEAGRELLSRGSYRYYDASCQSHDDCGEWFCANGWCHAAGTIGPDVELPLVSNGTGTGTGCLGDDDPTCNGECIWPGYCHEGRGDEPMSFLEIDGRFTTYADYSCNYDTDCGPEVCFEGWCMARELAGTETRTRADYRYFDASCAADADCRGWTCVDGWCEDPTQIGVYKGNQSDDTEAAAAYRNGTVTDVGDETQNMGMGGLGLTGTGSGGGSGTTNSVTGSGTGTDNLGDLVVDDIFLEEVMIEENSMLDQVLDSDSYWEVDVFEVGGTQIDDGTTGAAIDVLDAGVGAIGIGSVDSEEEESEESDDEFAEDPPAIEPHPIYAAPDED